MSEATEKRLCVIISILLGLVIGATVEIHLLRPEPAWRGPAWQFDLECDLLDDVCEEMMGDIDAPIREITKERVHGRAVVPVQPRGHSGGVTRNSYGDRVEQGV